ncbi:MAG: chlorophyll a/b-binding protein [Leptolyngbya sp.]|nr:chlorophyll a/b-binding protein [Leptolyngbya sp.]
MPSAMTHTEPTVTPVIDRPKRGFNDYAERLNGRAAMLGFVALVVFEWVTGQAIVTWLGLR